MACLVTGPSAMPPQHSPNFAFLVHHDPRLVMLATQAELYFADDPNTCLVKLRQFSELLALHAAAQCGLRFTDRDKNSVVVFALYQQRAIDSRVKQLFTDLRDMGNKAAHALYSRSGEALHQLRMARELAIWFYRAFLGASHFNPGPFLPPPDPKQEQQAVKNQLEELRKEFEANRNDFEAAQKAVAELHQKALTAEEQAKQALEEKELWEVLANEEANRHSDDTKKLEEATKKIVELQQALGQQLAKTAEAANTAPVGILQARLKDSAEASKKVVYDEVATRRLIDVQIRAAGWEVDSAQLTFEAGARPEHGKNKAIAEWPCSDGRADYVFFRGLVAVAIAEAKRLNINALAGMEQAKRYAKGFSAGSVAKLVEGAPFDEYQVPLMYSTNGRPYLKQIESQSGVWLLDGRSKYNHPRAIEGWYTPEGVDGLLRQDISAAEKKLAAEPKDRLGLRDYQIKAIEAVEEALSKGQRNCLIAMATGTGKTKTAIGLMYRLAKTGRFRRILFLVDRTALGQQTIDSLKNFKLEGVLTFPDIFEVKELVDTEPGTNTRLHISTVQAMIRRITDDEEGGASPVDQYDCILVDECHRGYGLDRSIGDVEMGIVDAGIRDFADYVSKYSQVLNHFDAVRIGLTATPAKHTSALFGDPVYQYSYREGVLDGVLIDHDAPLRLVTKLAQEGIHFAKGDEMAVISPNQVEIDLIHAEDEIDFEIESFNRQVLNDNFNRVVCEELARHIDPFASAKTLVFCVTEAHADTVVRHLKKAFEDQYGPLEDNAVIRLTGTTDKYLEKILWYKNEKQPNVAVTVDLLTTGIDVHEISNIVFLRRVRSRILYEQMLGRATRPCPKIKKEYFRIFDAVDLYAALEDYNSMKAVVTNPKASIQQLVRELGQLEKADEKQFVLDQLVAKLQRKKQSLTAERKEQVESAAGVSVVEMLNAIRKMNPDEVTQWFQDHPYVVGYLDDKQSRARPLVVSEHEDTLVGVETGYGKGKKPDDYLEGFANFVRENINKVPALMAVATHPKELTRSQLKEVVMLLDQRGFDERTLRAAWRDKTNEDIAANILGFIRQAALGSALIGHAERVDRALKKLLTSKPWTSPQKQWLEILANQIKVEIVVDRPALDQGIFQVEGGGFARLNKRFEGQLELILAQINSEIWDEVG